MESIAKFVCISAVAHSAFLLVYLRYDFYNTIFKIKHKFLISSVSATPSPTPSMKNSVFFRGWTSNIFFKPVISFFFSILYVERWNSHINWSIMNVNCWFQASAAKQMRTAFFWALAQRVVLFPYRRFAHTIGPIFKVPRIQEEFENSPRRSLALEDGTNRLFRNVCKELPLLAA